MIQSIYYLTQNDLQSFVMSCDDKNRGLVFYCETESTKVLDLSSQNEYCCFIKVSGFYYNGSFTKNGALCYNYRAKYVKLFTESNYQIVLSRLSLDNFESNQFMIFSNIIRKDDGNRFVFKLYNNLEYEKSIFGASFGFDNKCFCYNGKMFDYFFLILSLDNNEKIEIYDDFWNDYKEPLIVTDSFDGGFKSINWQDAVSFFLENLPLVSWNNIEEVMQNYPLKILTLKNENGIIAQTIDLKKSLVDVYTDISIFPYQSANIQTLNSVQFNKIIIQKILMKNNKNLQFLMFSGILHKFYKSIQYVSHKLFMSKDFKRFNGPIVDSFLSTTSSSPFFTTNSIFALRYSNDT